MLFTGYEVGVNIFNKIYYLLRTTVYVAFIQLIRLIQTLSNFSQDFQTSK